MKKLLAVAIAAAALNLAACATTPDTRLNAGKADALAWNALNGVAVSLDTLAKAGTLHGAEAAKAAAALTQARAALTAADAAYAAGDNASAQQNVATASALIATLLTLATQAQGH